MLPIDRETRDQQLFTGRDQEIRLVHELVDNHPGVPTIVHLYGNGGVGKSFLIGQISLQARSWNIPVISLDCKNMTLPGALNAEIRQSAKRISGTQKYFREFDRDWKRLETIEGKIKKLLMQPKEEPKDKFSKAAGSMAGTAIEIAMPMFLPGPGGEVLGKVLGRAGEAIAQATTEKITNALIERGLSQQDAEFYTNASDLLAASLYKGINNLAQNSRSVIFFVDTLERLSYNDELWLRNLIIEHLLLSKIVIIFSGRRHLDSLVWRDWNGKIYQRDLKPFTLAESFVYLQKRGVKSDYDIKCLFKITRGLPLALAVAALIYTSGAPLDETFWGVKAQIVDPLLAYFLERVAEPQWREDFLMSAIPRFVNVDVLEQLFSDRAKAMEVYERERSLYTTTIHSDGLVFHDVVRDISLAFLRQRSPEQLLSINQRLANYFAKSREEYLPFGTDWQRATLEYIYHLLFVDENRAIQEAAFYFLSAQEFIGHSLINSIIQIIEDYPLKNYQNRDWLAYCRAQLSFLNSRFDDARNRLRGLLEQVNLDPYLKANALTSLAVLTQYQGRVEEAISLHEQGLQVWRQLSDQTGIKRSLTNVGRMYRIVRDWKRSLILLDESRRIAEAEGDWLELGRILLNTGYIALYQGRWIDADKDYSQALNFARQGEDRYDLSKALMRLGQLRCREGREGEAIKYLQESISEYRITGELFGEGFAHTYLGSALAIQRKWDGAVLELNKALDLFQLPQINAQDRIGDVHHSFGEMFLAKGDLTAAQASFLQAVDIRRKLKTFYYLPKSLIGLCLVEFSKGNFDALDKYLKEAEDFAVKYDDYFHLARLREIEGHLHLQKLGDCLKIARLYHEAFLCAFQFNGYAVLWVLRELSKVIKQFRDNGEHQIIQEVLDRLLVICTNSLVDGKSFEEAERLAYERAPGILDQSHRILASLQNWASGLEVKEF